jgi:hypothetical protein
MTSRATADYPRYNSRSEAVSEVDVISRSESKDNDKECPSGKRASVDNDNCMIHDPKQVTRCRLNEFCSSQATSDDRESESRGEEEMSNYDVFATSRLGRFEERNVGDTEPATDTHNANTDDRAITTDQIRELLKEMESLISNQKQKMTAVLMNHRKIYLNQKP